MCTLTVAVSSGREPSLRERLLASLHAQRIEGEIEILFSRPGENLSLARNRMCAEARSRFVYFLDEDCWLPDDGHLARAVALLERGHGIVGGYYLGGTGIWARTYNALANLWLDLHGNIPVAGNFALDRERVEPPFRDDTPFGGEEIALLGKPFTLALELSVYHDSRRTMATFFSRAWRHGLAPRAPYRARVAVRALVQGLMSAGSLRIRALMVAYLATVATARVAWHFKR